MRKLAFAIAAATALFCASTASAQLVTGRAPQWANNLLAADLSPSTGGRPSVQGEGIAFSVRVTIAPYQGGVARVIRVDGRGAETELFLRRFTGHPTTGWWLWGPETPVRRPLTAAQRAELERLASAAISATGGDIAACPSGEQAFVEVFSRGRATVASRACIGADGVGALARAASDLAGSRDEEELNNAAIAELMDADRAFNAMAQAEGVPQAFAHWASDEAAQFAPRQEPAATPEARAALWEGWGAGDGLSWAPMHAAVSQRGDMGWTWGNGVRTFPDGRPPFPSRYVTIWKRNYDGEWRFVADIGVQGPALPAAPATPSQPAPHH